MIRPTNGTFTLDAEHTRIEGNILVLDISMSKQMTNSWYTTKFKSEEEKKGYDVTVKPCMTPEKKLLYEVFALLETHMLSIPC